MLSLQDIQNAQQCIRKKIHMTPVLTREFVNERFGGKIILKLENLQRSGAFKIRGVINKINSLTKEQKKKGVICATSGNHGLGVAYVSRWERLKSVVVVPETTPEHKLEMLKELSEVEISGHTFLESYHYATKKAERENLTFIHPFADPLIMAGQGTIGLELLKQTSGIDCVVCPIGGGGLISGILVALKESNPLIKVVGVQAEGAASMFHSWKDGKIKALSRINTIAEGIAVKKTEPVNLAIIKKYIDDIVLVSDKDIRFAMKTLFEEYKVVGETAGVVSLAAVLKNKIQIKGEKVVCLITGGNICCKQFFAHIC